MRFQLSKIDRYFGPLIFLIIGHLTFKSFLSDHWFLDLFNHFLPYEIGLFVLLFGVVVFRKSWKWGLFLPVIVAVGYWGSSRYEALVAAEPKKFDSNIPPEKSDISVQVISFNVYTPNRRADDVVRWIETSLSKDKKNLVFLMETNGEWVDSLEKLQERLPYSIKIPREDNFGLVLLSDTSLNEVKATVFDSNNLPAIAGYIENKKIRIVGAHTLPPISASYFNSRNKYFKNLRNFLDSEKIPTLVFGDFNSSPWSPHMKELLFSKKSDDELILNDSFNGIFRPHTWGVFGGFLSIPIDYILYTPHFRLQTSYVGPDLGSDHLPVVSSFQ